MSYRYIGNKSRISDRIVSIISRYVSPGQVVADPMCGTAAISQELRSNGYRVVASDIMTYAVQHASVRLTLDSAPPFKGIGLEYHEVLNHLNRLDPLEGFFYREFSPEGKPKEGVAPRKYFQSYNAKRIDAIRDQLNAWASDLTPIENDLLRHDFVLAANRVANIAGTYGHFRSKWSKNAEQDMFLRPSEFVSGNAEGHEILQGPVEDIASQIVADACYLDPPYMKRQYAANYHVLETIARGDEPEAIGVSGLRNWWDQYSNFCSKRNIKKAFADTFHGINAPTFFVSYSEDGLLPPNEMFEIFSTFGSVERFDIPLQRFKSNNGGKGGMVTEFLYVIHKNDRNLLA